MVYKIWHASDFTLIFSTGHNSRKGDNSDKKKMCISYFSMRNPYMKLQNPSMHGSCRTDGCTDEQPKTNMPRQLLRSWGHNDPYIIKARSYEAAEQQTSNNIRVDINC